MALGTGKLRRPRSSKNIAAVAIDATLLWCRWALRRLEHLIAGRLPVLAISVGRTSPEVYCVGVFLQPTCHGCRRMSNTYSVWPSGSRTFVVREEGVDPCAEDLSLTTWPEGYRAGIVEGLFLDARGYVDTTPDLAAKGARILSVLPTSTPSRDDSLTKPGRPTGITASPTTTYE